MRLRAEYALDPRGGGAGRGDGFGVVMGGLVLGGGGILLGLEALSQARLGLGFASLGCLGACALIFVCAPPSPVQCARNTLQALSRHHAVAQAIRLSEQERQVPPGLAPTTGGAIYAEGETVRVGSVVVRKKSRAGA